MIFRTRNRWHVSLIAILFISETMVPTYLAVSSTGIKIPRSTCCGIAANVVHNTGQYCRRIRIDNTANI